MKKISKKYIGSSPMKLAPWVLPAVQIGMGLLQGRSARRKQRAAQRRADEFEAAAAPYLEAYKTEEYVNPYENMENVYEDMRINTQAAEFQRQQLAQQQADVLQGLQGAAGSAGVAALAQAMARQGAIQAQKISTDISKQEEARERARLQEESRIQNLQAIGEERVRQQERMRTMNLYQLEAGRGAIQTQQAGIFGQEAASAFGGAASALIGGISDGAFNSVQSIDAGVDPMSLSVEAGNFGIGAEAASPTIFGDLNLTPFKPR